MQILILKLVFWKIWVELVRPIWKINENFYKIFKLIKQRFTRKFTSYQTLPETFWTFSAAATIVSTSTFVSQSMYLLAFVLNFWNRCALLFIYGSHYTRNVKFFYWNLLTKILLTFGRYLISYKYTKWEICSYNNFST